MSTLNISNDLQNVIKKIASDTNNGDTLPIGAIVDYNGTTVPDGYEEVDYPPVFTAPSADNNGWGKFDFPTYTIYFKNVSKLASFNANAWSQLDLGSDGYFPPNISYNPDKMIFSGTALALDSAIVLSVGIYDTGNTGITCTYQNKYTGNIPNSPIRLHFTLIVKK